MLNENQAIKLGAVEVLTSLRLDSKHVASRVRELWKTESKPVVRAELLFGLMGIRDESPATVDLVVRSAMSSHSIERRAAAVVYSRLRDVEITEVAQGVIIEAICDPDFDEVFYQFQCSVEGEGEKRFLLNCLSPTEADRLKLHLLERFEAGDDGNSNLLIELVFPYQDAGRVLMLEDLDPVQLRTANSIVAAKKRGQRVYWGYYPSLGLPESIDDWKRLVGEQVNDGFVPRLMKWFRGR